MKKFDRKHLNSYNWGCKIQSSCCMAELNFKPEVKMEDLLSIMVEGNESSVREAFKVFNEKNNSNFKLGESLSVRKTFCSLLLAKFSHLTWNPDTVVPALNALRIFTREQEGSSQLVTPNGLAPLVRLAGLDSQFVEMREFFGGENIDDGQVNVMVEAVKCLCNIVLKNHTLATVVSQLGCLGSLRARLTLASSMLLPHDILFFDLRLLFLITACGPDQRVMLRDELSGLSTLVTLLDSVLFGPTEKEIKKEEGPNGVVELKGPDEDSQTAMEGVQPKDRDSEARGKGEGSEVGDDTTEYLEATRGTPSESMGSLTSFDADIKTDNSSSDGKTSSIKENDQSTEVKPKKPRSPHSRVHIRDNCYVLSSPMTDKMCTVISETLKIIFNQTVNWKQANEFDDDEIDLLYQLSHLLRIIVCSVPLLRSKVTTQAVNHCCEVLMNIPSKCHHALLLPPGETIAPKLQALYPTLHCEPRCKGIGVEEGKEENHKEALYSTDVDQIFDEYNMAVAVCLLNYLNLRLCPEDKTEHHGLTIVLGTMSLLCKGHRTFRRYCKTQILPPMREVKERPEAGTSLKARLVRLMTAGPHDCMDMVAEFLFVLCKENAARLVKHTGYGNAAGLLMSHGLLGGGRSEHQSDYSSDSDTSDTEEYHVSKDSIDPVTGGPSKMKGESPLDHMSPEEIEEEAAKLEDLFDRLNKQGTFKLVPLDKDNQPIKFPEKKEKDADREDSSDTD